MKPFSIRRIKEKLLFYFFFRMTNFYLLSAGGRGFFFPGRQGAFRGRGQPFSSRRPPFQPEEEFGRPFGGRYVGEEPYFYGDAGRGIKRPFSMMVNFCIYFLLCLSVRLSVQWWFYMLQFQDHDSGYMEPGSRVRPRYDHPDPLPGASRYRGSFSGIFCF